jgi:hypothetical protein
MSDKDTITDAQEAFKAASEAEADNRKAWIDDLRFARLGEQWPAEVKRQREREGRPCLTINRLPAFIRQVTNDAQPEPAHDPCSSGRRRSRSGNGGNPERVDPERRIQQ